MKVSSSYEKTQQVMSTVNAHCCDAGESSVDSRRPKFQDKNSLH